MRDIFFPGPNVEERLYLITPDARPVAAAIEGGVDLVQLRNKELDDEGFLDVARTLVSICHDRGVRLILNDRVHLVEDAGADGAHVGEDDMGADEARTMLGPDRLLGVSTHNAEELAVVRDADYAGLGPMFSSTTKHVARTPGGAALVQSALGQARVPVFPIGGIDAANVQELVAAGATRIAVGSAICDAADPRAAAAELARAIQA